MNISGKKRLSDIVIFTGMAINAVVIVAIVFYLIR